MATRDRYVDLLNMFWLHHVAPKVESSPTLVSTFAGCGGSSLGYSIAGFKELLAVEWDNHAVGTFRMNFPDVPVHHGDINELTVEEALAICGLVESELDVLDGSPPCQGFSTSGKRELEDVRNTLFGEFVRLLEGFRPAAFVMENVSGMIKGKMRVVFSDAFRALEGAGYKVRSTLLNSAWFDVPQERERVIFMGTRADLDRAPVFPRPRMGRPYTVTDAFEGLPETMGRTLNDLPFEIWKKTAPLDSFKKHHPKGHWFNAVKAHPNFPLKTIAKTVMKGGESGWFHWQHPRVFTIGELKRCQSFPDGFEFEGPFQNQWAQIGNSVPPLMMRAIAATLREKVLKK